MTPTAIERPAKNMPSDLRLPPDAGSSEGDDRVSLIVMGPPSPRVQSRSARTPWFRSPSGQDRIKDHG
jgi:hypothetical protein